MKALVIGDTSLPPSVIDVPLPVPAKNEVRIRVVASALNRADLLQSRGLYPAPPGVPRDIPGLEYAGIVDACGEGATKFAPGARVFGLVGGGALAEFLVVHEREVASAPEMPLEEAAAVPEAFVTAYDAMVVQAGLLPGERLLIHAVGSGVGTAAIQIARTLGCRIVGTSRTAEKLSRAEALGLHRGVLAADANGAVEALRRDEPAGFDVILDLAGGDYVRADMEVARPRARIAVVGLVAGAATELNLGFLLRKRVTLFGTVLRSRAIEEKIAAAALLERTIVPWLDQRIVRPIVDSVVPLAEVPDALARMAKNDSFGKIVVRVSDEAATPAAG